MLAACQRAPAAGPLPDGKPLAGERSSPRRRAGAVRSRWRLRPGRPACRPAEASAASPACADPRPGGSSRPRRFSTPTGLWASTRSLTTSTVTRPVAVAEEQAVVPDAEPHQHGELAAVPVEQLGLRDRVAHRLEAAGTELLAVGETHLLLGDLAVLAGDGDDFEAVALEDAAQHVGVPDEADAAGDAELPKAHPLGELHDLLEPRPSAVALGLDHGRLEGDPAYLRVVVDRARGALRLGIDVRGAESRCRASRLRRRGRRAPSPGSRHRQGLRRSSSSPAPVSADQSTGAVL